MKSSLPSCEDAIAYEPHRVAVSEIYDRLRCKPPRILAELDRQVPMEKKDGLYCATVNITFGKDMPLFSMSKCAARIFGTTNDIKIYTVACSRFYSTTLVRMETTTTALSMINCVPHAYLGTAPKNVMGVFPPGMVEHCIRTFYHATAANGSMLCRAFPNMQEKDITKSAQYVTNGLGTFLFASKDSSLYTAIEFKMGLAPVANKKTIPKFVLQQGGFWVPKIAAPGLVGAEELLQDILDDLKTNVPCIAPSEIGFRVTEMSQFVRAEPARPAPETQTQQLQRPTLTLAPPSPPWSFTVELVFVFSEIEPPPPPNISRGGPM